MGRIARKACQKILRVNMQRHRRLDPPAVSFHKLSPPLNIRLPCTLKKCFTVFTSTPSSSSGGFPPPRPPSFPLPLPPDFPPLRCRPSRNELQDFVDAMEMRSDSSSLSMTPLSGVRICSIHTSAFQEVVGVSPPPPLTEGEKGLADAEETTAAKRCWGHFLALNMHAYEPQVEEMN